MEADTSQLISECKEMKAELATFEQKTGLDDLVNPSMLQIACMNVDKLTDMMVKFLHENSITRIFLPKQVELESFIATMRERGYFKTLEHFGADPVSPRI